MDSSRHNNAQPKQAGRPDMNTNRYEILNSETREDTAPTFKSLGQIVLEKCPDRVRRLSEDAIVHHTSHNTYTVNIERTVQVGNYSYSLTEGKYVDITPPEAEPKKETLEDLLKHQYRKRKRKKIEKCIERVAQRVRQLVDDSHKYPKIEYDESMSLDEYMRRMRDLQAKLENKLIDKAIVEADCIKFSVEQELKEAGLKEKVTVQAGPDLEPDEPDHIHYDEFLQPGEDEFSDDSSHQTKYNKWAFEERMKKVYSFGSESLQTVGSLKSMLADVLDSVDSVIDDGSLKYVKMLEDVLLFWYLDVPHLSTRTEMIAALYRLTKSITGYSICDSVFGWLNEILNEYHSISAQAGPSMEPQCSVAGNIVQFMSGEVFAQLQKLVCAISTVVLAQTVFKKGKNTADDVSEQSQTLFEQCWSYFKPMLAKKLKWDICDTVIEFFKWMMSRGIEVIRGDRTFKSLFFEGDNAKVFDERVARLDFMFETLQQGTAETTLEMYMQEIVALEALCQQEFATASNKVLKVTLQRQLQIILKHKGEMLRMYAAESVRPQPFSVLLFGTTSTGKSTVGSIIIPILQRAMGVKEGPEYVFNHDCTDKYMSEYSYEKNTISMDDLANTQVNVADVNASDFVIYLINNFKRYAVKADVESKGKIPIRPAIVTATTNCPELHSRVTSVEPLSIMRRFSYHVEVKVKPCCGYGPPDRLMMKKEGHNPHDHGYDCWDLSMFTYESSPDSSSKMVKTPVTNMQNVSLSTATQFLAKEGKIHRDNQLRLVQQMNTTHLKEYCPHNIFQYLCMDCKANKLAVESLNEAAIVESRREAAVESLPLHLQLVTMSGSSLEPENILWHIGHQADRFAAWCKAGSLSYKGSTAGKKPAKGSIAFMAKLIFSINMWKNKKVTWWQTGVLGAAGICLAPFASFGFPLYIGSWFMTMTGIYAGTTSLRLARYMRVSPLDTVREAVKAIRRDWKKSLKALTPLFTVVGVSYASYKIWKHYQTNRIAAQGCITSVDNETTAQPKVVPKGVTGRRDPYRPPVLSIPIANIDFKNSTSSQMSKVLQNKLVLMRFKRGDKYVEHCASLPVCTGYWLVPYHVLRKNYDSVEVVKDTTLHVNSTRTLRLEGTWKRIGKTDYCLVYLPAMGDQRDIRKLFPSGDKFETKGVGCKCVWIKGTPERLDNGDSFITVSRGEFHTHLVSTQVQAINTDYVYDGSRYESKEPTWLGMCGCPLLTDVNGPTIIGLHSAGREGTSEARTSTVLRKDIDACIAQMTSVETGQWVGAQSGDFSKALDFKGTNFRYIPNQRPKATSTFVDIGAFEVLGSFTAPHRNFRSSVQRTLVCKTVCDVMGYEEKFGPPRLIGTWVPWNVWVSSMSHPSDIPQHRIDQSYRDFKNHIWENWQPDWEERIKPVNDDIVLAGYDGLKGCYAMNMKSSMGIPYCKPKKEFITLSTRLVEGISCPRDMPQHLHDEVILMEEHLASGVRVYAPHRCSLKDEPTKLDKDKVRIFMGTMFAYQFLMRKYFLMMCVIMQEHPEIFQSAVGVNAASLDWSRLYRFITQYGPERTIAGDFAGYDQKLDVKVLMAFMKIILLIFERVGYTSREITICEGLVIETVMAVYDVQNDLMQFNCGNSSGNSITVVLNGGGNVINTGCVFHELKPDSAEQKLVFNECVALMTYGDDNVMSVHQKAPWFNHTAMAEVYAKWGFEYTMADKKAESVPYIHIDDAEFLKRKWVWSEQYKRHLCPLREDSIVKSLTSALKSKELTPEVHAAQVIMNANMEYWFHGKEVFLERHAQLKRVLEIHDITHHVSGGCLMDYEDMEQWYLE